MSISLALLALAAGRPSVSAATATPVSSAPQTLSVTPTQVLTGAVVASAPSEISMQKTPALNLAWNETNRVFSVTVANTVGKTLQVLGVQSTNNLFVVSFPSTIPPAGSSKFDVIYYVQSGTNSTTDLLRVLTDQGPITVQVDSGREQAATLSAQSLQWAVGDAVATKTVNLTMEANTSVPTGVTVLGRGITARLLSGTSGNYQIAVTPSSTAKPLTAAVAVNFQPSLPGTAVVLSCNIVVP